MSLKSKVPQVCVCVCHTALYQPGKVYLGKERTTNLSFFTLTLPLSVFFGLTVTRFAFDFFGLAVAPAVSVMLPLDIIDPTLLPSSTADEDGDGFKTVIVVSFAFCYKFYDKNDNAFLKN